MTARNYSSSLARKWASGITSRSTSLWWGQQWCWPISMAKDKELDWSIIKYIYAYKLSFTFGNGARLSVFICSPFSSIFGACSEVLKSPSTFPKWITPSCTVCTSRIATVLKDRGPFLRQLRRFSFFFFLLHFPRKWSFLALKTPLITLHNSVIPLAWVAEWTWLSWRGFFFLDATDMHQYRMSHADLQHGAKYFFSELFGHKWSSSWSAQFLF